MNSDSLIVLEKPAPVVTGTGKTILIAEPNRLIALDLEAALRRAGFDVLIVSESEHGDFEILELLEFDAAIVSLKSSQGTGEQIAQRLAAHNIPFAICTGRSAREVGAQFPGVPVIAKPYDWDDLVGTISDLAHASKCGERAS